MSEKPRPMDGRLISIASAIRSNPMTYAIDALRTLTTPGFQSGIGESLAIDLALLIVFDAAMVALAAYLFTRETRRLIA